MFLYLEEQFKANQTEGNLFVSCKDNIFFFFFGDSDPKCEWPKHIKQNLKIEGA